MNTKEILRPFLSALQENLAFTMEFADVHYRKHKAKIRNESQWFISRRKGKLMPHCSEASGTLNLYLTILG